MPRDPIESTFSNIQSMKVRGAARIARAAALALKEYCTHNTFASSDDLSSRITTAGARLIEARPTAVSLPNAVNLVLNTAYHLKERGTPTREAVRVISATCDEFVAASIKAAETIGEIGAKRIVDGDTVLTHCNSEMASSVLIHAKEMGRAFRVIVTETRPRFQGRLTASLLARKGLDVALIPDTAARVYMHDVDKVVVGADAIASNGAVVNKIGTSQIALIAHESRAKFYVAAETLKLSSDTLLGELVEIEQRSPLEVVPKRWVESNKNVKVMNPAFDVTPPEYIDLIITEKGVFPPQGIVLLMRDLYPTPTTNLS